MSPIILPDTSEAEDMDPSEAGTYPGIIVKTDAQLSREKKVPQAVIQFQIKGVPAESDRKPRDIKRTVWINVTGGGSMQWDRLLRATGFDRVADELRTGAKVPFNTDELKGKECLVVLKVGTYQDRRRDEISGFLPPNGSGTTQ